VRRALTAIGATLLALACAEIGLRIADHRRWTELDEAAAAPPPPAVGARARLGDIIRPSRLPGVVYELRPDLDVLFQGAPVRTGADGLRRAEAAPPPPSAPCTLLGLGDSVMFGWGVPHEATFLERTAAALGPSWRAVNTAVPGYNTAMQAARLEHGWSRWRPDVVVVHVVLNDLELPPFLLPPPDLWSPDHSALWRRFRRVVGPGDRSVADPWGTGLEPSRDDPRLARRYRHMVGLEGFRRAIARIAATGRAHDVPVIVLLDDDRRPPWSELGRIVRQAGLHAVTTVGAFGEELARRGLPRNDDSWRATFWLSPTDPHPNATGHRVISRRLVEALETTGLASCGRPAPAR